MPARQNRQLYAEDGHDTGISAYSFDVDQITVLFGVGTHTSRHVRENYKRKWRKD